MPSPEEKKGIEVDPKTQAVFHHKGYKVLKKISQGAFGEVFKAKNTKLNEMNAVKVMHLDRIKRKGMTESFLQREIDALIAVRHPNVLTVYDIFKSGGRLYIFMEFAPNGTLEKKVKDSPNKCLPEEKAKFWFRQCVEALHCMHFEHHMAHRDIKLENVLMDPDNNAKLSDFGFARQFNYDNDPLSKTFCGTQPYYAPEIVGKQPYDPMLFDIWSMGVMLFFMLNGKFPFDFSNFKDNRKRVLQQMKEKNYNRQTRAQEPLSEEVTVLLDAMFTFKAEKRPNIIAVRGSDWLTEE